MDYFEKRKKWKLIIASLFILLGLTIILTTAIGPVPISPLVVFKILTKKIPFLKNMVGPSGSSIEETIIFQIRLPRIILGALVGAALAVSGATMQGLFKIPWLIHS